MWDSQGLPLLHHLSYIQRNVATSCKNTEINYEFNEGSVIGYRSKYKHQRNTIMRTHMNTNTPTNTQVRRPEKGPFSFGCY